MRANGIVVAEILHFKNINILLNTGFGFSHVITRTTIIRIAKFSKKPISVNCYKYLKISPCLTL
jgi:hypothetical protein